MKRMRALARAHRELIMYFVFGVLATVLNYTVYWPCFFLLGLSAAASNAISWCAAVLLAFFTNKPLVFRNQDWSLKTISREFGKFVSCRFATGVLETITLFVAIDCLNADGNITKICTNIGVIILNYILSKLFVFRKRYKEGA